MRELGEVVVGKTSGRVERDDITLFKSLGIALEDVAVGAWVYGRARMENRQGDRVVREDDFGDPQTKNNSRKFA